MELLGINSLFDLLEFFSFIATIIGGIAILFAVRDYSISRKQLHLSVLQSCVARFRDHFMDLNLSIFFAGDMSTRSGTFSVGVAGVYQMSFTAKYVSSSKGRFGAWSDIYVNNTVSRESPGGQLNRHFPLPRIRPRTWPKSFLEF